MQQNKKTVKMQHLAQNEYKLGQRQSGHSIGKLNLNKFIKRKPDPKKIIGQPSSKKKRQSNISEYFAQEQPSTRTFSNKQISLLVNKDQNISAQKQNQKALQTTRSQNMLSTLSNKEISHTLEDSNKISKTSFFSKASQTSEYNLKNSNEFIKRQSRNFNPYQRITCKKSRTQYFDVHQCLQAEISNEQVFKYDSIEDENLRQQFQRLTNELTSLNKKNKLLQEQLQLYLQRNYLLETEKKHIEHMGKEKDKIIDRLQREKSLFKSKGSDNDKQIKKCKEQLAAAKAKLEKQQQIYSCLKQENQCLLRQIDQKNDELIIVYDQYTDLQAKYKKDHQQMSQQRQRMKQQIQMIREQIKKEEMVDLSPLQIDKWKQLLFKQQQEIKYLQIQNQCLMISKDQLTRYQAENRKLRDERDYFKKKIMENIKRNNKRYLKDFSRSENSITVLQLSEVSS